jgi:hypothetical protein
MRINAMLHSDSAKRQVNDQSADRATEFQKDIPDKCTGSYRLDLLEAESKIDGRDCKKWDGFGERFMATCF